MKKSTAAIQHPSASEQEVAKVYMHRGVIESIGRKMALSDLADAVLSRIVDKAWEMKFAAVHDHRHYINQLKTAARHDFLDLVKSKGEQAMRYGIRLDEQHDEFGLPRIDLPSTRSYNPAIRLQAQEDLRIVQKTLNAIARQSNASRQAVRIFRARIFNGTPVRDIALAEQLDETYIHVAIHRVRKRLREKLPELAAIAA